MSPVYNVSLIPPSVKTPPNVCSVAAGLFISLVSQKDISDEERALLVRRLYQNGLARVEASGGHARPIIPETTSSTMPEATSDALTAEECQKRMRRQYIYYERNV